MSQLRQVADAADFLQLALVLQPGRQGHQIDRLPFLAELHHRFKDQLMGLVVEILGAHPLHRRNQRFGLKQNRTEHRLLRFQVLRGNPVKKWLGAHVTPP
ncbi:hypothetical protein D1872_268480 [compost metagenome]